ncbi:30S ribosomal protein S6 [Phreatobacter oligotrophus]|jgi:small subunit ribosomal protein S6|uniref:Small ribosomal subunit protein bS6 n=1 Tax=Phreatobacter oligotrophus TaxID=1122261 RepID=A0A2T4ZID0_9HYPH|nr:30S ribosomal protein S6 [Phreatobacter oligotrophus]PTM61737.1 SSU ribosomal protein S6P [Phreatobacter oligotrophus]
MPLYEHVFLARQDVTSQQAEALAEQYKGVIEANGGSVAKVEPWGLKSIAFRIRKNRKAHYTLMNINAPSAAVVEMERQMAINEDILRFMTVKVEELEEGPSAMLQKRDRDERGERGFGDRGFGGGGGRDRGFGGGGAGGGGGGRRFRDRDGGDIEVGAEVEQTEE